MDKTTEKGKKQLQRKTAKFRKTEQDTMHELTKQERKRPTENKISLTFINTADYDHSKQG